MQNYQQKPAKNRFGITARTDDQSPQVSWLDGEPKGIQNRSLLKRVESSINHPERYTVVKV